MKTTYCMLSDEQREKTIKNMHANIFWCLLYKERNDPCLENYFNVLMFKLGGLNSLLGYPDKMVELLMLLEAARIELYKGEEFNFQLYRKAILDAETVVGKLFSNEA